MWLPGGCCTELRGAILVLEVTQDFLLQSDRRISGNEDFPRPACKVELFGKMASVQLCPPLEETQEGI